jgi:hypothetical protein
MWRDFKICHFRQFYGFKNWQESFYHPILENVYVYAISFPVWSSRGCQSGGVEKDRRLRSRVRLSSTALVIRDFGFLLHYNTNRPILSIEPIMSKLTLDSRLNILKRCFNPLWTDLVMRQEQALPSSPSHANWPRIRTIWPIAKRLASFLAQDNTPTLILFPESWD